MLVMKSTVAVYINYKWHKFCLVNSQLAGAYTHSNHFGDSGGVVVWWWCCLGIVVVGGSDRFLPEGRRQSTKPLPIANNKHMRENKLV